MNEGKLSLLLDARRAGRRGPEALAIALSSGPIRARAAMLFQTIRVEGRTAHVLPFVRDTDERVSIPDLMFESLTHRRSSSIALAERKGVTTSPSRRVLV